MGAAASFALPIAGAVLGGIGGSKSSGGGTTTTSSSSAPWQPQQEYLTSGFKDARTALDNALANPVYQGQRVAGLNPFQTMGANTLGNFSQQNAFLADQALNASNSLLQPGANFGNNAQNIFNQFAGMDPTQQILGTAAQYANNPYIDGMIDASGRDVTRQLNEQTLPSLNRQFSGTGNTNSTRAGVQSAIAERGAADRLADMSSNIRGQFFGKGLEQGQSQFNQNLQNSLAANQGLLDSFRTGMGGLTNAQGLASGFFDQSNAAGGMFQNQEQRELAAAMDQFNETNRNPLDFINSYMQAVGGNYGGTSTGTSTAPKVGGGFLGGLTGALGGAMGGLGMASSLGGMTNSGVRAMNQATPGFVGPRY
jgi:hypothetical protein